AAVYRKEPPRRTDANEDKAVIAHGRSRGEKHIRRCDRTRQTGRDLLDVASGLPVSRVAGEDNALRIAEPRASSEPRNFALWQSHSRPAPGRQENQMPVDLAEHPLSIR